MKYDIFTLSPTRQVLLCGTNYYPTPEYHVDRIMKEHDLMFISEGIWQVAQDGVIYNLNPGSLLLLRAGSHHWGTMPCSVGSRNIFIHFNREQNDRLDVALSGAEVHSLATGLSCCIATLVQCGLKTATESLINQIIQVYWGHQDDKERRLNLLLNLLLNELASLTRDSQPEAEEWIVNLLKRIAEDHKRILTLEEAAESAGFTPRTFSDHFRKIMGKSFHSYQLSTKLEMAYNALRTGRYTVKDVAEEYGFTDPYYFSRLFRKHFGVSPVDIRRGEPSANINRPFLHTKPL